MFKFQMPRASRASRPALGLLAMFAALVVALGSCTALPVSNSGPTTTSVRAAILSPPTTRVLTASPSTTVAPVTFPPRSTTTRGPVTTTPPPPTTTTTLVGADRVVRLGEFAGTQFGCDSTDLFGSDVDSTNGTLQIVCKDRDAGRVVLHTLVLDAPGAMPRQTGTVDLGSVSALGDWAATVELVESTDRTFVLTGSTMHVFRTSTMEPIGATQLSVSGITLVASAERSCDGSTPSGAVFVSSREGRAVVMLDPLTGAELARRDLGGRVLSLGVSPRSGRVAAGVATWSGMDEYILAPDTLATVFSRPFTRFGAGNFGYSSTCDQGGDLTRFENSSMITSIDTSTGATSFWLPSSRFEATVGPVVPWSGSDIIRTTTDRLLFDSSSLNTIAVVRVAGPNGHASMGNLMDVTWQESGRVNLMWSNGSIEIFCIDVGSAC